MSLILSNLVEADLVDVVEQDENWRSILVVLERLHEGVVERSVLGLRCHIVNFMLALLHLFHVVLEANEALSLFGAGEGRRIAHELEERVFVLYVHHEALLEEVVEGIVPVVKAV